MPSNIFPFSEDTSNSNVNSYYDIDNPVGVVNTYNLAAPNNPTPNGNTYPGQPAGDTNAFVDTTMLRVNFGTPAGTLTVTGGGSFSGTMQDGSGTVALTVAGACQTLTLSGGSNTFSGQTTINSTDTLLVNGTDANSPVSVSGTLGGTGTVAAVTVVGSGAVNPGSPANIVGTLHGVSADFNLTADITGVSPSVTNDEFVTTGAVTLGGASTLTVDLNGLQSSAGTVTVVNAAGGVSGTFTTVNSVNNPYGYQVTVAYTADTVTVTVGLPADWVNDNWVDVTHPGGPLAFGDVVAPPARETAPNSGGITLAYGFNAFASIQDGVNAVESGGTVYVLAGMYAENDVVTKSVSILGPNAGLDGTSAMRGAEAIVVPAVADIEPGDGGSGDSNGTIIRVGDTSNFSNPITGHHINGLEINGDNPNLPLGEGRQLLNGKYTFTGAGITNIQPGSSYDASPGTAGMAATMIIEDNVIENLDRYGVDADTVNGTPFASDAAVTHNYITNLPSGNLFGGDRGRGVQFEGNYYGTVGPNTITDVNVGYQNDGFYAARPHWPGPGDREQHHQRRFTAASSTTIRSTPRPPAPSPATRSPATTTAADRTATASASKFLASATPIPSPSPTMTSAESITACSCRQINPPRGSRLAGRHAQRQLEVRRLRDR